MRVVQYLFLSLCLMALAGPAYAQQTLPGNAVPAESDSGTSPVSISRFFTANNGAATWASCIDFTNVMQRRMTAIQFKFTYWDAFDSPITTFRADRVGDFAPGVLVQGPQNINETGQGNINQKVPNCWTITAGVGSLSKVTAEVVKIRYGDGEIWVAPAGGAVFTGTYMGGGAGFVDPPRRIQCGMFSFAWWAVEQSHTHKMEECVKRWESANGNIAGWPTAEPSPTPAASASPDGTASP
jgi:hypothetical protein